MSKLVTTPNLDRTDDFYAALLRAHDGLSAQETHQLNARLILVLANHIGELDVLQEALDLARGAALDTSVQDPTKA